MEKVKVLEDGMIVYHASYQVVEKIDLTYCRKGLDFGKGFYVTTSFEQAKKFLKNTVGRAIVEKKIFNQDYGYINVYEYVENEELNIKIFENENVEWLHFIANNRDKKNKHLRFDEQYDIIGGKIANDLTTRTLSIYLSGGYGEIGTKEADDIAIKLLLPNNLKDQYCFLTEKSLKNLKYIRNEKYEC